MGNPEGGWSDVSVDDDGPGNTILRSEKTNEGSPRIGKGFIRYNHWKFLDVGREFSRSKD